MRARSRHLVGALFLAACSGAPRQRLKADPPPGSPPSPCERAHSERARVPALLTEGKLDRSSRVLERADTLCPASAGESGELGKQVKLALNDDRSAEALFGAGQKAYAAHDRVEMQRAFDRAIKRAELQAGEPMTLELPPARPTQQGWAWSGDGSVVASIGLDTVSIRERRVAFRETRRLGRWSSAVEAVAMSPNGKMLAVGTEDNLVRLIDTSTWSETKKLTHRPGDPLAGTDWHPHEFLDVLNFSPDGTRLLSGTWDGGWAGSLCLWDVRTGAELLQYDGRAGGGRVAYSPDGKTISTLTPQSGPERWDAATGQRLSVEDLMDSHPDQDLADAAVSRWRAKTGVRGGDAWQAAVPPDRERVAVWVDGTLELPRFRGHP